MNNPITARAIVAEARSSDAERKGGPMGIKRILVVDDSATERHMLKDLLTKAGYDVVSSENGEDAIVKARQVKPDLDRKSTRLNSSHMSISYAVFCLKK